MHALSDSDLLAVWERGLEDAPLERALQLLSAGWPEEDVSTLANLSIGDRDGLLLRLRGATFGSALTGVAACTLCREQIEVTANIADFLAAAPASETEVAIGGYELRLRPPNSLDLAASDSDLDRARVQLLEACIVSAEFRGVIVTPADLPEGVTEEVERRLAEADPQSDIQMLVDCPKCGSGRKIAFDIVSFFFKEIEHWAHRLLREVHALAAAYGWSESAILSLGPFRRRCYLDLVGA